jgi:CRISPR/Cas system-associated exonuclease Cas4 (RecB family)
MSAITFDALSSAKRLREKGIPQEQAEAIAAELRAASELDLSHLATKDELKAALSEVKADIIKWVVGMSFAQVAMVLTILKLH